MTAHGTEGTGVGPPARAGGGLWSAPLLAALLVLADCAGTHPGHTPPGLAEENEALVVLDEPWVDDFDRSSARAYLELATHLGERREPLTSRELDLMLTAVEAAPPAPPLGLQGDELRRGILDALGVRSLLDGLEARPLAVAVLGEQPDRRGFTRRKLLFGDPLVGSFDATLLLPEGDGARPAVLGLHGHDEDDEVFSRRYLGESLAIRGFVVLMPRFRVTDCSLTEGRVARALLLQRSSLMGLRVYESLLMLKYLRTLDEVDATRLGLLGHSGGSTVANLVARISPEVTALVIDHNTDFRDRCGLLDWIHCETLPELFPLSTDVNHLSNLPVPWYRVPYGFEDRETRQGILSFFRDHLTPEKASTASGR